MSVGSNCGDRRKNVERALSWLRSILMQTEVSGIYETPCALKRGKPYLNAVVKGFYEGSGIQLDDILKEKEREIGRHRDCELKGDVLIDMDIVVCNREVYKEWDFAQKFFQIGYSQLSNS